MSFLFPEVVVVLKMADSPPAKRRFAPAPAADVDKAAVSSVPTNTKAATFILAHSLGGSSGGLLLSYAHAMNHSLMLLLVGHAPLLLI